MAIQVAPSEQNPGVLIAHLSDRLDMASCADAGAVLRQATEESQAGVILDLAELVFISSAGLRVILQTAKILRAAGKDMAIIRPQPGVLRVFQVSMLDAVFSFFDTEAEALKGLWSESP